MEKLSLENRWELEWKMIENNYDLHGEFLNYEQGEMNEDEEAEFEKKITAEYPVFAMKMIVIRKLTRRGFDYGDYTFDQVEISPRGDAREMSPEEIERIEKEIVSIEPRWLEEARRERAFSLKCKPIERWISKEYDAIATRERLKKLKES